MASLTTTNALTRLRQRVTQHPGTLTAAEPVDGQNRPMHQARARGASPLAIAANLLVVYVVWGSTYLAIRLVVETLPPFLSAAARFLVAGGLMLGFLWLQARLSRSSSGLEPMTWRHWRSAAIIGGLLLLGGNGFVVQSERFIDSGIAAVLVAAVPIWMSLFDALVSRRRPSALSVGGVFAGFIGILILLYPFQGMPSINPFGIGLVVLAAVFWAAGSVYARHAAMPRSGLLGTGMEMVAGGALLVIAGVLTGEPGNIHPGTFSTSSLLALGYLVVFGSLVAFSAYTWLLNHVPVSTVSTYAYVNPVVAVALGALFLHEPITLRTIVASALIIGAVVAMVSGRPREEQEAPEPAHREREGIDRAAAD
jgi:drug/metabolite transporter (DMT)-like permease